MLGLVMRDEVQQELQLVDEQKDKVRDIADDMRDKVRDEMRDMFSQMRDLSDEERAGQVRRNSHQVRSDQRGCGKATWKRCCCRTNSIG